MLITDMIGVNWRYNKGQDLLITLLDARYFKDNQRII